MGHYNQIYPEKNNIPVGHDPDNHMIKAIREKFFEKLVPFLVPGFKAIK